MAQIIRYTRYLEDADSPPSTAFPSDHELYLPLVDVQLSLNGATTPPLKVLLDSGAAYCLFGEDTAELLGIRVRSGRLKQDMRGLGGAVDVYFFNAQLAIGTITIHSYVGFMEGDFPGNDIWMGLLGEHGFLDQVAVAFDAPNLQIRVGSI